MLATAVVASLVAGPAFAEEPIDCPDYRVYGAAGTNAVNHELADDDEELLGKTTVETAREIRRLLAIDDVTVDLRGIDYPASVFPYPYDSSIADGLGTLGGMVEDFVAECPDSQLILVGYSLGGDLVGSYAQGVVPASPTFSPARDRIAGVVLLGDPRFNSSDEWADSGTYSEERSGLFFYANRGLYEPLVVDPEANPALDMAVVSICRAWDLYCQGSSVLPNSIGRLVVPDPDTVTRHNPEGNLNYEHEHYRPDDVKTAACELVTKLGYDVCAPPRVSDTPIDVAFLIDTTSAGFGSVAELQSRAEEFVNDISHGAVGTRYAVISYGEAHASVQTIGFTDDEGEVVDAIEGLNDTGGTYGALYSAIGLANDLGWREDSRKLTLTLSTSRTCSQQFCSTEYGTGEQGTWLLQDPDIEGDVHLRGTNVGAYTRDNQWFFESAGWSWAFGLGSQVRLGEYGTTPFDHVEALHQAWVQALTSRPADPIVGTVSLVAGGTGSFRAASIVPYYPDSPDRRLVWSVERTGDIGPRGSQNNGGGGVPTASRVVPASETNATVAGPPSTRTLLEEDPEDPEEPDEPLPEDQGPAFQTEFETPGTYAVTVTAYLDGAVQTYEQIVRVYDAPEQAPAAPVVESYIDGDEQVFHWFAGDGEFAPVYVFFDEDGLPVDSTAVETTLSTIGDDEFERRVTLADPGDRYTLSAWNEVGLTAATPMLTANAASYSHAILDDNTPTGGELSFSGRTSVELAALLDDDAELDSDQTLKLHSPQGDAIEVDTLTAEGDLSGTPDWTLDVDLLDARTPGDEAVTPLLEDGFIDELLLSGSVDLKVGGVPVEIVVEPGADVEQLDEYVIETNATPPAGTAASLIEIDQNAPSLRLGSNEAGALAFVADAADPLADWSGSTISDVRTWIGTTEVTNTLTGSGIEVTGDETPTDAVVDFGGRVVGGSGNLTRQFLQNGTLSFVVDGGTPTVVTLAMTASQAATAFPDLDPPKLVGRTTIGMTQYLDREPWSPVLSWGTGATGQVTLTGSLPIGLDWDPWQHRLTGVAEQAGTYPVSLTAHGEFGEATKTYDIVVGAAASDPLYPLARLSSWESIDESNADVVTVAISAGGYFRVDNPAFASTLPVIDTFAEEGYLYAAIDNVEFFDSDGDPIPVSGDMTVELWGWGGGPDQLNIAGTLSRTDAITGPFATLLSGGGRITFTYLGGATNTVQFAPNS